jgi:hypothetical protein
MRAVLGQRFVGFTSFTCNCKSSHQAPPWSEKNCAHFAVPLWSMVQPYLTNGVFKEVSLKRFLKAIHTNMVAANKRALNNKLLRGPPPDIDPTDRTLPRSSRCTLTQLRSRKCKDLKSYQHEIGSSPDDICPACRSMSHTTAHLFACPALPTNLGVLDLGKRSHEATYFQRTIPSFSHLPPNPPPSSSP